MDETRITHADPVGADGIWSGLDVCWQEAFRQAWDALRTGNVAVGPCAATPDGTLVHAARNRVTDHDGPPGEVFGSALATPRRTSLPGSRSVSRAGWC